MAISPKVAHGINLYIVKIPIGGRRFVVKRNLYSVKIVMTGRPGGAVELGAPRQAILRFMRGEEGRS
jgi:hypothetical protein